MLLAIGRNADGTITASREKAGQTFTTSEVEDAVLALHSIPPERRSAFAGRVRNLQKAGLLPGSPGPGRRAAYDCFDVAAWVIIFALTEAGLQPSEIAPALPLVEPKVIKVFASPDGEADYFLWIRAAWLSRYLQAQADQAPEPITAGVTLAPKLGGVLNEKGIERATVLNLSHLKRRLASILPVEWPTEFAFVDQKGQIVVASMSRGAADTNRN